MKKFTKLTLTLAMLFGLVGGVSAKDVYATLADGSTNGSATWVNDGGNYTFTWTKSSDDYVSLFTAFGGTIGNELDLSEGTNIHIQRGALTNGPFYISIVANGKTFKRGMWSGNNPVDLTLTATSGDGFTVNGWGSSFGYITANDLAHVTDIRVEGNTENAGSIVLSNVYAQILPRTTLAFGSNGIATIPLSKIDVSGDLTYDSTTGELTSTGTGEVIIMFDKAYDFVNVNGWTVTGTGTDIFGHWQLKGALNSDKSELDMYSGWFGRDVNALKSGRDLSAITGVKLYVTETGTYTFSELKFTATPMSVVDARDVPIATLTHYEIDADGNASSSYTIATNYGSETEIALGDGGADMNDYIDIAEYDELRIYTSDNARVFFIKEAITSGTNSKEGATAKLDNSVDGQVSFSHNTTEGYYYANVSDIKTKYNGQAKVIGVKGASWGAKLTVSKIQVYKNNPSYAFILSGQYSSVTDISAVTSAASATAIDCSGLSGNDITITTLNPNCLFYAGSGVLSNTKNVIVSGTCANLELTDGKPFKAPAGFTATSAKFTKTVSDAGYATMVIPFTAALPSGVTAKNLIGYSGETIIPSDALKLVADEPVLIKADAGDYEFTATDAAIADGEVTNGLLKGSYVGTTATADGTNYVLQKNGSEVNFYKVTGTAATVKPFRAYLSVPSPAPVLYFNFFDMETTGLNDVRGKMADVRGDFFDLQGRKVANPTKGLYIVNGKKVMVK